MGSHSSPFSPDLQQEHQQPPPQVTETPITGAQTCVGSQLELQNNHNVPPDCCNVSPPRSPGNIFTDNTSLKSELDKIKLRDHRVDNQTEVDEALDPENINVASLLSRIRQIRSGGQIQYRVPKKRKRGGSPKPETGDDMEIDSVELSDHEVVTVNRQKRVKKTPRCVRSSPYNKEKRHQKSHKEGQPSKPEKNPPPTPAEARNSARCATDT